MSDLAIDWFDKGNPTLASVHVPVPLIEECELDEFEECIDKGNSCHGAEGGFCEIGGGVGAASLEKLKSAALRYQEYSGDSSARALLTRAAKETLPGGAFENYHPGDVTVYRAGGHSKGGASYYKSRKIAEGHLFVGSNAVVRELHIDR